MPQRGVLYDFSHFESTNQLTNLNGWTLDTELHHKSRSEALFSEPDESHMAQSIAPPWQGRVRVMRVAETRPFGLELPR